MWLEVSLASEGEGAANAGRRAAAQFFFHYELPKIGAWLNVVETRDMTCAHLSEDAF
jgi:butyryl-CoA dehydrogenase